MHGLSGINIELTSRCQKACHCCGRRKLEREHPELAKYGDMPIEMVKRIADQIPPGVFIQLHRDGEPLLYPRFDEALKLFSGHYIGLNTNGKLLMEKAEAIRTYLSTITISIIPDDPEEDEQLDIAQRFLEFEHRPLVIFRMLGQIDHTRKELIDSWTRLYPKVMLCHRILHSPDGSFDYEKRTTKPEAGLCLEMLHKLAIDRFGNVYPCVRFDPLKKNLLGNVDDAPWGLDGNNNSLLHAWLGKKRKQWIQHHIDGRRDLVPLCKDCDFWGCPRG